MCEAMPSSIRVEIIQRSACPFCVLFFIFLELITQFKNRERNTWCCQHYPIWSLFRNHLIICCLPVPCSVDAAVASSATAIAAPAPSTVAIVFAT